MTNTCSTLYPFLFLSLLLLAGCIDDESGVGGRDGADGKNALVSIISEPSGDNCIYGGQRIESGIDLDENDTLDSNEVTATSYVCNGSDGDNGLNALIDVADESVGENCRDGGLRINTGVDSNINNILEPDEVMQTGYVCQATSTNIGWQVSQYIGDGIYIGVQQGIRDAHVARDNSGNAIAVWIQTSVVDDIADLTRLAARRYSPDNGWGEIYFLSDIPATVMSTSAEIYSVISDNNGDVLVYWNYDIGGDSNYYLFDRFTSDGWITDGGSVSERALGWGTYDPMRGRAVADGNDNIIAVGGDTSSACDVCIGWSWLRRYTPDSGWGEALDLHMFNDGPEIIDSDNVVRAYTRSGNPDVATNAAGDALVVWWEVNAAANGNTEVMIMASRFSVAENSWSDAQFVSQGSGMAALHPNSNDQIFDPTIRVTMTENGSALVEWRQIDKTLGDYNSGDIHIDLWSNQYNSASGWGTPHPY